MMSDCDNTVTKGGEFVVAVRNDADTEWEIVGGVKSRSFNVTNPTEETTSSSTVGDYGEAEFTGFSQFSINMSGVTDNRVGQTDPATGYTVIGAGRMATLATTGDRCGKFQMISTDASYPMLIEGFFNITSFENSGDTPGLLGFTATLENKRDVTVTI
jgi:predicted secreted protein